MFLPENFKIQEKSSKYLKLTEGTYKIRFISEPVLSWVRYETYLDENKQEAKRLVRERYNLENQKAPHGDARQAISLLVWNHDLQAIQYLEITQKSLIEALHEKDKDGFKLDEVDIKIVRKGTTMMNTEYKLDTLPNQIEMNDEEVKRQFEELQPNLEMIFETGSPFPRKDEK